MLQRALSLILILLLLATPSALSGLPSQTEDGWSLREVRPHLFYRPSSLSNPGTPPFTPSEIQKAYGFTPLHSRGILGNATRIAIVDAYGNPSLLTDLATFNSLTGLPPAVVNFYYPDGVPRQRNNGWALETSLDVEWAHAMAPLATIDLVVARDASVAHVYSAIAFVASSLPGDNVLSMSFGLSESLYPATGSFTISAFHQLFVTIVSHGTTPVASSGDSGASGCCDVSYPASDPLVVAVGGTSLVLNTDASYSGETAWSGSGAGASIVFTEPSWQLLTGSPMRDTADVAYNADVNTGVLVVSANKLYQVGGTSAGAPQWAALIALAGQENSAKYGSAAQYLYKISSYHDVTVGSNGFFSASAGWDYPTGRGSPDADATVRNLAAATSVEARFSVFRDFTGFKVWTNGTLILRLLSLKMSGTVEVSALNLTTGGVSFSKAYSVPSMGLANVSSGLQASFLANVAIEPYPLSSYVTASLAGQSATVNVVVSRQVDTDLSGSVDIVDLVKVSLSFGSGLGDGSYDPRADMDASGIVNIVDLTVVATRFGSMSLI